MKQVFLTLFLLLTLSFLGCGSKLTPEQGSGVLATEERVLESFQAIEVNGIGTVNVIFGNVDYCSVKADDNLVAEYETRVEEGTLFLSAKSLVTPKAGITVTIKTSNPVERVKLSGACEVRLRNVSVSDLNLECEGSNRFTADGRTRRLVYLGRGNVQADLFELETGQAEIDLDGSCRVNLSVEDMLKVKATGAAVVTYDGQPTLNEDVSGVSRVVERED